LDAYRDSNTGEVNIDYLPQSAKSMITKLSNRNKTIVRRAIRIDNAKPKQNRTNIGTMYKKYRIVQQKILKKYVSFPMSE
jgi:hypothetical protein